MRFRPLDVDDLVLAAQKPSRYVGGEVNAIAKELGAARATWALCFPDTYEVGMSNLGFRLLYHRLNARPDVACERAFMPWPDMEAMQRARGVPLWALESRAPLRDFDILGFSLQFEACYTTCLAMLDLAGVPVVAAERTERDPLVIAGGPCAVNPEPVAPFFDAVVVGDGEEVVLELTDAVIDWRASGSSRRELVERLARIRGVYVPSLFLFRYAADGTIAAVEPLLSGYERVGRRVVADLSSVPPPERPVLPFMQTVHDRLSVEIQRGCTRGCRFCQAGMINRPVRQRSPAEVLRIATRGLAGTGFEEVGLLSLSAGDYGCLDPLLERFFTRFGPEKIAVSLPSMRTETMSESLARQIARVRKTGFTLAPEAATDRLRGVINKGNAEADLLAAIESVFRSGWSLLKLYFMIGLPTETDEDVRAIAALAQRALKLARGVRREATINVAVSTFVPKPFTPFQWEPMATLEETIRKHDLLLAAFPRRGALALRYHGAEGSMVEGALTRGDRRVATAVLAAFRAGQRLDNWTEHFDYRRWTAAFGAMEKQHGVSMDFMANRERGEGEVLPWAAIDAGVEKAFLWRERLDSRAGKLLDDCAHAECPACGACDSGDVVNRIHRVSDLLPEPPATPGEPALLPEERSVVRVRYAKRGRSIAVSHLETMSMLLRALRRARVPVVHSEGHNPKPRVSLTPACPVGVESEAEYVDVEVAGRPEPGAIGRALAAEMPAGFFVLEVSRVEAGSPSLNASLTGMSWRATFPEAVQPPQLAYRARHFAAADGVEVARNASVAGGTRTLPGRLVDLKGALLALAHPAPREVVFCLRAGNQASAKPSEVLASVFGGLPAARVVKEAVQFGAHQNTDEGEKTEAAPT